MNIHKFTFNPFFENTYIIWDKETKEAAVIDPGMSNEKEEDKLASFIEENSLKISYLINTHCHIDHILGCSFIKTKYNPVYYMPEKDLLLFENAENQAAMFGVTLNKLPELEKFLSEDEKIKLGNESITMLFTPGHSPGEFCLYMEDSGFCISGDVLFDENIGRTDLPGGNFNVLIDSIENKLLTLPDEVVIYPGHGEKSTIGHEKLHNPFLS